MTETDAIRNAVANGPFGCVLNMPTGSGKTWLAKQAISDVLSSGQRAIYVTPLRALADEIMSSWAEEMAPHQVGVFTGDYGKAGKRFPVSFTDAQLLIMTPERLDACTRFWRSHWSWIPEVDVVVVDEVHLLGEANRGGRLEGAVSCFRRLNPFARIVGLSATLGNPDELAEWLEAITFRGGERPIPLEWNIVRYRKSQEKPDRLLEQVSRNVSQGGSSLVFVQSRRRAEELSRYLVSNGIKCGHHHAGLTRAQRNQIESSFRDRDTQALVATSTLEMGLNLPVRQVVLYDLQSFNGQVFSPLSTNSVWQRVGRAGRRGLDSSGEAVLLAPNWDRHVAKYAAGSFEPIRSQLHNEAALAEQIVAEVASGLANTRIQVANVLGLSLASLQERLLPINEIIDRMHEAGLLKEVADENRPEKIRIRATRIGRIAVRNMLSPETVLRLRRVSELHVDLTFFDLFLVVACCRECEPIVAQRLKLTSIVRFKTDISE